MTRPQLSQQYMPIISKKETIYFDCKKKDVVAVETDKYFFVNPEYLSVEKMKILGKEICYDCRLYFDRKLGELMDELPQLFKK
jgi:hypothetical protein